MYITPGRYENPARLSKEPRPHSTVKIPFIGRPRRCIPSETLSPRGTRRSLRENRKLALGFLFPRHFFFPPVILPRVSLPRDECVVSGNQPESPPVCPCSTFLVARIRSGLPRRVDSRQMFSVTHVFPLSTTEIRSSKEALSTGRFFQTKPPTFPKKEIISVKFESRFLRLVFVATPNLDLHGDRGTSHRETHFTTPNTGMHP